MDLQAILDASSSDDDGDVDYLRYAPNSSAASNNHTNSSAIKATNSTTTHSSNVTNTRHDNFNQSEEDDQDADAISNLSNVSSPDRKQLYHRRIHSSASEGISDGVSEVSDGMEDHLPYVHRSSAIAENEHPLGGSSGDCNYDDLQLLRAAAEINMEMNWGVDISTQLRQMREECGLAPRSLEGNDGKSDGNNKDDEICNIRMNGNGDLDNNGEDLVGQILKSYQRGNTRSRDPYYRGEQYGNRQANLELERILREADANDEDDDDDDDDDDDGHNGYNNMNGPSKFLDNNKRNGKYETNTKLNISDALQKSPSRPKNFHRHSNNDEYDILQSILNEDDDNDDDSNVDEEKSGKHDDSNHVLDKYSYMSAANNHPYFVGSSPSHQQNGQLHQQNRQSSSAELSALSNVSGGDGGERALSSSIPLSHSMEVDAILNSVKDDDEDDDDDNERFDMNNYHSTNIDTDTDESLDTDIGLNSISGDDTNRDKPKNNVASLLSLPSHQERTMDMQYPLSTSSIDMQKQQQHTGKDIFIHADGKVKEEDPPYSLKKHTANFLSGHGKIKCNEDLDNIDENIGDNASVISTAVSVDGEAMADNASPPTEEQIRKRHSANCLRKAEAYERRLLKPNTRHIVSPLSVKRRMKPKVELMTKSRINQSSSSSSKQSMSSKPLLESSSLSQPPHTQNNTSASQQQQPRFGFSGGIIQMKSMSTLGSHLLPKEAASSKSPANLPTALAVNSKFIAVGAQNGDIWVFDLFEQLKATLGGKTNNTLNENPNSVLKGAPVTSIDLSLHGDYLLAGYGSGVIILWDIFKESVLKSTDDLHTSPITSVRLTSFPMAGNDKSDIGAVSVDAGGLVNKLVFSKGMLWSTYSVETECLLDGTAGQILAMEALPPLDFVEGKCGSIGTGGSDGSRNTITLIALSSDRSSFAVSVEPKVSVLHRWARPAAERIDPTVFDRCEQSTQASSNYASTYASSYVSSYASSYLSSSTYASTAADTKQISLGQSTPLPFLPCLSWGWALVSGGGNSVTPILARAWGSCLQFLRASFPDSDGAPDDGAINWPAFGLHDEFNAPSPVVALNWLGKRSLVYLTITNEFTIVDTVIMTMQERLDFSSMNLVYAEFALSRQTTPTRGPGSNICTTFMNSIRSSDDRLMVLCREEVKQITVLGMRQQITSLEEGGQWLEALALALDHFESTIVSQEDRRRDQINKIKQSESMLSDPSLLSEDEVWMAELLMRYLKLAIENAPESSSSQFSFSTNKLPDTINFAHSHFEMLSGVCFEYCIVTRRLDLLFGRIFQCFYEARYINVFLDVMESYILNDKLKYVAPEAMALFVEHCKDIKDLQVVERCLLHMETNLMDFDSILSLLKKNLLFSGMFHVYCNGLDDFVSPMELLFEGLFDATDYRSNRMRVDIGERDANSNKLEKYGYKAILYLVYSFNGKYFPKGDAIHPENRLQTLRRDILDLLFRESYLPQPRARTYGSNPSINGIRSSLHPYLRALLLIDTNAFLDCLSIVLDDPFAQFESTYSDNSKIENGVGQNIAFPHSTLPQVERKANGILLDRQHLTRVLSSVIMPDSIINVNRLLAPIGDCVPSLPDTSKPIYLDFLAKYLKKGVVAVPKYVTTEVFTHLCTKKDASEEDVLSLLNSLPQTSFDLDEILHTVEDAGMARSALLLHKVGVAQSIYRIGMKDKCEDHFNGAIDCFLTDKEPDFQLGLFSYVRQECAGESTSAIPPEERYNDSCTNAILRNIVLRRLHDFIKVDPIHSAHLVADIFVEEIDRILTSLNGVDNGRVEYEFLNAIISGGLAKVDTVSSQELAANLSFDHHHRYLALMVQFQPDSVYRYLSSSRSYRLDDALKLCQERRITDASAYLLERMGDVSGALQLMLKSLDTRMMTLKHLLHKNTCYGGVSRRTSTNKRWKFHNEAAEKEISGVKQILVAILDLCERNKNEHLTLDNERGPLLWFHVLDRLAHSKSVLRISKENVEQNTSSISTVLSELLLMTMQRMISNVSLYDLMHKITTDYAGSDLGEFREMLVSMLKTYSSELDVCSNAVDVMYHDILSMCIEKKKLKVRGAYFFRKPHSASPYGTTNEVFKNRIKKSYLGVSYDPIHDKSTNALYALKKNRQEIQHESRSGRRGRYQPQLNLLTMSEKRFSLQRRSNSNNLIHCRQVGMLSEAQHVGGLL